MGSNGCAWSISTPSAANILYTRIWFCVSVPVLSVHITVVAPIVSVACILRTRLFVFIILRMLYARLNDTLIGNPSGILTTNTATASMNALRKYSAIDNQSSF